jgi:hypothetical protein
MKFQTLKFVASFCGLTSLLSVIKTSCIQCPSSNVYFSLASVFCLQMLVLLLKDFVSVPDFFAWTW